MHQNFFRTLYYDYPLDATIKIEAQLYKYWVHPNKFKNGLFIEYSPESCIKKTIYSFLDILKLTIYYEK